MDTITLSQNLVSLVPESIEPDAESTELKMEDDDAILIVNGNSVNVEIAAGELGDTLETALDGSLDKVG